MNKAWKILESRGSVSISWHPTDRILAVRTVDSIQLWDTESLP
jgi:hypothetical protein